MRIHTEDEVHTILAPYHDRILKAVIDGCSRWENFSTQRLVCGLARYRYKRTVACSLFEEITDVARNEFADDSSVKVVEESQTVKFCFDDKVIARFKKDGGNRLGVNILTKAIRDFNDPQASIPGVLPEVAKVDFVWKRNEIEGGIERVSVVARDGNSIVWAYDLNISEIEAETAEVLSLPLITIQSNDEKTDTLVKPKIGAIKHKNKS